MTLASPTISTHLVGSRLAWVSFLEFCIPVIQDYGLALKRKSWETFHESFIKLLSFFAMYNGRGSILYHTMYLYWLTIRYWERSGLPIKTLFQNNHTLFSEESGEIALSVLQMLNLSTLVEEFNKQELSGSLFECATTSIQRKNSAQKRGRGG